MLFRPKIKILLIFLVLLLIGCTRSSSEPAVVDDAANSNQTTAPLITDISINDTPSSDSKTDAEAPAKEIPTVIVKPPIIPKNPPVFPENTPAALHGSLTVKGPSLLDSNNEIFQLRGISTHGIEWYGHYINEACFKHLRDEWQINVIRLAMYTDDNTDYPNDREKYHTLMRRGIDIASELGLYVVVDWHNLSDGNPNSHIEDSLRFFDEFATEYVNYSNVIFEICNEPNGTEVTWDEEVKPYAEKVIDVIRKTNNDSIIIVGTPTWCQNILAAAKNPIEGTNIMYALHFYSNTHTMLLREMLKISVTRYNLPVFVSEFGTCSSTGDGDTNITESDLWLQLLNELNISWINWSLSDKKESASLLLPGSGINGGWSDSQLTTSGNYIKGQLTR